MTDIRYVPQMGYSFEWDNPNIWSTDTVPTALDNVQVGSPGDPPASTPYAYQLNIEVGQTFSGLNIDIASNAPALYENGTLNAVGTLSLDSYVVDNAANGMMSASSILIGTKGDVYSAGTFDATGSVANAGQLVAEGLTVNAGSFANTGLLDGSLTVNTAPGGFLNQGALEGGRYLVDQGDQMLFNVGGTIKSDAATILLGGGDIESFDPLTLQYEPIEQTMTSIAAGGVLEGGASWGQLAVSGTLVLGGAFSSTDLSVTAGGVIVQSGFALSSGNGTILNNGTISEGFGDASGPYRLTDNITGTGIIQIQAEDTYVYTNGQYQDEEIGSGIEIAAADTNDVVFMAPAGDLQLDQPLQFTGTIVGFGGPVASSGPNGVSAEGSSIILSFVDYDTITSETYVGNASGGTLDIVAAGTTIDLQFAGDYTTDSFVLSSDLGATIITGPAPCFVVGTRIETADGQTPVEDLRAGMDVRLNDGSLSPIVWIGSRRVRCGTGEAPAKSGPIRVRTGALGHGLPRRDLLVSPDHALFLDGVLVPAGLLVNGETIVREPVAEVRYFHVELERHAILLAEGAPAESYLDTGNRRQYGNCPFAYDPSEPGPDACAEMVLAGARLDAIRASLPLPVSA